jgi:hypothetical protein
MGRGLAQGIGETIAWHCCRHARTFLDTLKLPWSVLVFDTERLLAFQIV